MDEIVYLDFDLLIQRAGAAYRAQVLRSPAGEAAIDFSLPSWESELDDFLSHVGRIRRVVRRLGSSPEAVAKAFGGRLFQAIFHDAVHRCLATSLDQADRRRKGLRIRLRLTDVPELADLPWEYLYDSARNQFLARSQWTPLVRYLDLPWRIQPLAVRPPLRVLVMIASPSDVQRLDVEVEWAKLKEALGELERRGLVALERLAGGTLSALQRRLRLQECHIIHFIGHGGFDDGTQDGVLLLEDEDRLGHRVSGQHLGSLLRDHRSLRLAVLNACEGARASRSDPFAGTAQSLVQQGMPAVIAMQFEITDRAAITFARDFYGAVADGYPVDAALGEARKAIYNQGNQVEWGTPVLYLRASSGRLFGLKVAAKIGPGASQPTEPVDRNALPGAPGFDTRILRERPGTPINPTSPVYVVRERSDSDALDTIAQQGMTITIKGPGQVGKSSLLVRTIDAALKAGKHVARLDFNMFTAATLTNADQFYREFCAMFADELKLVDRLDEYWARQRGVNQLCTDYIGDYILQAADISFVLAMDNVERIFDAGFRDDFFLMLRSWHEARAHDPAFKQLDLVLVTSTEPYYFIDNLNHSPFNVGAVISLKDFLPEQIAELNRLHGSPLPEEGVRRLVAWIGGHPFLAHQAIWLVASQRTSAEDLFADPNSDRCPFGDHLRNLLSRLWQREELIQSLRQVIHQGTHPNERVISRLQGMGLVRREGRSVLPRCQLFADFFREHLRA